MFPVVMILVPSFSPPPRFIRDPCIQQHLARLLSIFVLSASYPPVSVYLADLLQCLVPHCPSPIVRPLEIYQPSGYRPTNVLSWFREPSVPYVGLHPPPPRPVRLVVLGLGVGGGAKETAPPAMVLSISSRRQASPGKACLFQPTLEFPLNSCP